MSSQQSHNTHLSGDPNIAIQEVMDSIGVLRDVYAQETDALVDADTQTFLSLQEQKFEAARNYQVGIEALLKRKEELKDVNPNKKKQLEQMQKEFASLAEQNREALARMQRCVDRLGGTIRRAAKEAADKHRGFSYGECGNMRTDKKKRVTMGVDEKA